MALANSGKEARFPNTPDSELTPGSLCATPDKHRYPEKVPYCTRNVSGESKKEIIRTYDLHRGFQIQRMNRQDFKIDHLVPLCAGGSNEVTNLWPQHKSIYQLTDPIEQPLCELMARGRLKQEEAVQIILDVKQHPETSPEALKKVLERLN